MLRRCKLNNFLTILVCLLCVMVIPENAALAATQKGELKTYGFRLDGYSRRYLLYVPAEVNALPDKRPLVLVNHGGGGTDRSMMNQTHKRWNQLADEHGFFVMYPNAVKKMWDFGEDSVSMNLKKRVDDLAYFDRILRDVLSSFPVI